MYVRYRPSLLSWRLLYLGKMIGLRVVLGRTGDNRRERMDTHDWILVATQDAETRAATTRLFNRAGFRIRSLGSGEAALSTIDGDRPSLMIIDLALDDTSGYELCYEVKQRFGQELPVVLLSEDRTEPRDRVAGLLIGADDYLAKPFDPDELLARARRLLTDAQRVDARREFDLTPREIDVLRELADGLGRRAAARKLSISPKTVATHVQNILTKLGVHSSAEAVALAYRSGLIGSAEVRGKGGGTAGPRG